jgi:hypothetical protein
LKTSKAYNRNFEIAEGMHWSAFAVGAGAFLLIFIPLMLAEMEPLYVVFLSAVVSFVVYKKAQSLMGGDFYLQGWEQRLASWQEKALTNTMDLSEEIKFVVKDNSLLTDRGLKVYAWEVLANLSPADFEADMYQLVGELKYPHRMQIYRDSTAHKIEGVEAPVNAIRVFVILVIDPTFSSGLDIRDKVSKLMTGLGKALTNDELVSVVRSFYNKRMPQETLLPVKDGFLSQIRLLRKEALVHAGGLGEGMLCVSMAEMSDSISPRFQLVLDTLNSLPATICVSLKTIQKQSPLGKLFEKRALEKLKAQTLEIDPADRCDLRISITAVIHGTKKELEEIEHTLRRQLASLGDGESVKFNTDNAIMREVLLSLVPGLSTDLPMRRQFRIKSKRELVHYFPQPVKSGEEAALLQFRTLTNTLYRFDLTAPDPLFIYGPMGQGKTALISDMLTAFLEQRPDPHYFLITAGDGYHWLLDGLCDFAMIFAIDEESGRYRPLDFHPLQAFFSLGDLAIESAAHWLCETCNIIDKEYETAIRRVLARLKAEGKVRMSDFYAGFSEWIYEVWPKDKTALDHPSRVVLSRLYDFCGLEGSQFGYVFEPEKAKPVDMLAVKRFYATQEKAVSSTSDALVAYFNLCRYIFESWTSIAVKKKAAFIGIDELNHLLEIKAVTEKQLDTFNSQGRKEGQHVVVGTQRLKDLERLNKDFLRSFTHYLFAGPADPNQVADMFAASSEEKRQQVFRVFEAMNEKIRYVRRREGLFVWGYITRQKTADLLVHDLSPRKLWLFASALESRRLKQDALKTFGRTITETARLLSLYGPKPPSKPSEDLTHAEREYVYDRIIKHRDASGSDCN